MEYVFQTIFKTIQSKQYNITIELEFVEYKNSFFVSLINK